MNIIHYTCTENEMTKKKRAEAEWQWYTKAIVIARVIAHATTLKYIQICTTDKHTLTHTWCNQWSRRRQLYSYCLHFIVQLHIVRTFINNNTKSVCVCVCACPCVCLYDCSLKSSDTIVSYLWCAYLFCYLIGSFYLFFHFLNKKVEKNENKKCKILHRKNLLHHRNQECYSHWYSSSSSSSWCSWCCCASSLLLFCHFRILFTNYLTPFSKGQTCLTSFASVLLLLLRECVCVIYE